MGDPSSNPFPQLANPNKTSDATPTYNCIAWAFKDNRRHWWPNQPKRSYWPIDTTGLSLTEAFEKWFTVDGWEECPDGKSEPGVEKIALYFLDDNPTHAARQLPSGLWTSKLGGSIDLSHEIDELNGPAYGQPRRYFRKTFGP
jgi:hypothetical protein